MNETTLYNVYQITIRDLRSRTIQQWSLVFIADEKEGMLVSVQKQMAKLNNDSLELIAMETLQSSCQLLV